MESRSLSSLGTKTEFNTTEKPVIGVLYICTGKYTVFWRGFFESCEKNFLPDHEKVYFVFTDALVLEHSENPRVKIIPQRNLGWPGNTLYRFRMFLNASNLYQGCDFLFFLNANMLFLTPLNHEVLPSSAENYLLGVKHPGFYDKPRAEFTYEDDERSLAFIPATEGRYYYMGGFNGGRLTEFLELAQTCATKIDIDQANGIVAIWHDESHLNRYFVDHPPKTLDPSYGFPEGADLPFAPKVVIQDKTKFGGHALLRNDRPTGGVLLSGSIGDLLFELVCYEYLLKQRKVERVLLFNDRKDAVQESVLRFSGVRVERGASELSMFEAVDVQDGKVFRNNRTSFENKLFRGVWKSRLIFVDSGLEANASFDAEAFRRTFSFQGPGAEESDILVHVFADNERKKYQSKLDRSYFKRAVRKICSVIGEARILVLTDIQDLVLDVSAPGKPPVDILYEPDALKLFARALQFRNHVGCASSTSWWIGQLTRTKNSISTFPGTFFGKPSFGYWISHGKGRTIVVASSAQPVRFLIHLLRVLKRTLVGGAGLIVRRFAR